MIFQSIRYRSQSGFKFSLVQLVLFSVALIVGLLLIDLNVTNTKTTAFILFFVITLTGINLCRKTALRLNDKKLDLLGSLWIIKVLLTLVLLHVGWIPQLDPAASSSWGYDPQRFYYQSWDLVLQDWDYSSLNLNYTGILYYYGFIFYLFGHNPIVSALANAFVTLIVSLFLIRLCYQFMPNRTTNDWRIAYLLIIPDILWFDVMTSRETLMSGLLIFAMLTVGSYVTGTGRTTLGRALILVSISSIAILAIRTTMIVPVFVSVLLIILFLRQEHLLRSQRKLVSRLKFLFIALVIAFVLLGPQIQNLIGGYNLNLFDAVSTLTSGQEGIEDLQWSDNSIGRLLIPNTLLDHIIFLPARMVLYLIVPLPNFVISISDLIDGSWSAWQHLMGLSTSLMIVIVFPFVLASSALAWRLRKVYPGMLIIPIAFWMTFIAVSGGNLIIHERYRLMCTLLLFASAWIGYTRCPRKLLQTFATSWFSLLGLGMIFYIFYKFSV
jgi:hypothetical protein